VIREVRRRALSTVTFLLRLPMASVGVSSQNSQLSLSFRVAPLLQIPKAIPKAGGIMMDTHNDDTHNSETVAIKACCACGTGLMESNKFCRNCGVRQSAQFPQLAPSDALSAAAETVTDLPLLSTADGYHPVSGPLVKAVVASVSSRDTAPLHGRLLKSSILALISIPIWIMIVLLSPIDAYVAARTFSRAIQ
jgi:hypothetical protein